MPTIDDILPPVREVKVETPGGSTVVVEYRPDTISVAQQMRIHEVQQSGDHAAMMRLLTEFLHGAVVSWDLDRADGQPWPLDVESLTELPLSVASWVFEAISADNAPATEGESVPSDAG